MHDGRPARPFLSISAAVLPLALPLFVAAPAAYAVDYMSIAETQALMFPEATAFESAGASLTAEQSQAIVGKLGAMPNVSSWKVWQARNATTPLGFVVVASVIGKFQLIQFAVSLDNAGVIRDVEILSYRESHGGEVRTPAWRHQFTGKDAGQPLAIGNDINNISGATLSCTHLTDGIRQIATYVQLGLVRH